ncbi:uncharacterized protein LOC131724780 [Acipenser ruthenus]|uniref:uncharacterized protein LOC131724780 n=1 Tax=Acipenser ruthenus TaxID=7906 RepID=UPI002740D752|nr:uncharacterized protein LOC131724780 [Acipenser ruthenus]
MASRGCKHPADAFCYVCGQFIKTRAKKYSVEASAKMCEAYKAYFGMPVGDQDKPWAPHFTCEHCKKTLEGWYRGEKRAMKFAIPRIWREPTDHSSNCYFCMVDPSKRRTGKNAPAITYTDLPSSIAPVPHCHELPVPTPPEREQPSLEESSKSESEEDVVDPDDNFRGGAEERNPYYPNQKDLNNLIRDLGLTKSNAELLTSRLKQWNLLYESVLLAASHIQSVKSSSSGGSDAGVQKPCARLFHPETEEQLELPSLPEKKQQLLGGAAAGSEGAFSFSSFTVMDGCLLSLWVAGSQEWGLESRSFPSGAYLNQLPGAGVSLTSYQCTCDQGNKVMASFRDFKKRHIADENKKGNQDK